MRVGVLTGGGDCPGLNAAVRAVAKSLILAHGADMVGIEDGWLGLAERRTRPLSFRDVSGILQQGGTILGADNRTNLLRLPSRGGADVTADVAAWCREIGLDALVVVGGNGTMCVADRLQQQGLPIVGIPKTIDNDVEGTERTIGFDSAVAIATEAVDRIHTTGQSHHRVFLVETMGRETGWLALQAGLAGGADVVLTPEIEFDVAEVARVCRARQHNGPRFTIIVVAEGARPQGGAMVIRERIEHSGEQVRLGGVAMVLAEQLQREIADEVRAIVLGHTQRGGPPTAHDRVLATALGSAAADLVGARRFGHMVAVQGNRLTAVPVAEVANRTRFVPPDSPLRAAAVAVGTSLGVPPESIARERAGVL
jgi:ATP-dependent phosphofructokinase / diphosphate-dependent phosphofructokinase